MRKAVRHNKPNRNAGELMSELRQVVRNRDFFIVLQVLILVRVQCFSKSLFFSSTRTLNLKNPLFSRIPCRDDKKIIPEITKCVWTKFQSNLCQRFYASKFDFHKIKVTLSGQKALLKSNCLEF